VSWARQGSRSTADTGTKADPALLRQIAGIGNNLNQVARRVNSGEWGAVERVQVIAVLMAMERALQALSVPSTEVT
jgi:hypothetical protein